MNRALLGIAIVLALAVASPAQAATWEKTSTPATPEAIGDTIATIKQRVTNHLALSAPDAFVEFCRSATPRVIHCRVKEQDACYFDSCGWEDTWIISAKRTRDNRWILKDALCYAYEGYRCPVN